METGFQAVFIIRSTVTQFVLNACVNVKSWWPDSSAHVSENPSSVFKEYLFHSCKQMYSRCDYIYKLNKIWPLTWYWVKRSPVSVKTIKNFWNLKAHSFLFNFLKIGQIFKIPPIRNVNFLTMHCTAVLWRNRDAAKSFRLNYFGSQLIRRLLFWNAPKSWQDNQIK